MKPRSFENNFHSKIKPPAGETCACKFHYSGILREIVGYYELQALRDTTGERFVYAGYADARAHCKKFNKIGYGESRFWEALREVRERRIISNQVVRERWVSSGKKGRLV